MTMPLPPSAAGRAPRVNASRLWAGGMATAAVAALVAIVGILIARGVFDVAVLAPEGEGVWGDADTWTYAGLAAVAALVATGLLHLLILYTPSPLRFFSWVITLVTLVGVIAPFAAERSWASVATALINLALGITTGTLLSGVARSATSTAPSRPAPPAP
jgi:hypothetical protein